MNLYKILELNDNATEEEIKKAYRRLALKYHPDKCQDNNAREKFQEINYAYNILINSETRNKYNSIDKKNDFHSFISKVYNKEDINWSEELKKFGINITNKNLFNIGEMINNLNLFELIKFFSNNLNISKNINHNNCSESDNDIYDEFEAEYYNDLPIIYQKYNKNNINLELKININDILNSSRVIKINRISDNKNENITFKFFIKSQYIVYHYGGDIDNINNGHLIIKLLLPENYSWVNNSVNNSINYNYNITLYQYLYGLSLFIKFINNNISITNYIPYRDGNVYDPEVKIKNEISIYIKFNLIYSHNEDKQKILYNYFN